MDIVQSQADALDLLKDSDFSEGLGEFARLLAEARVRYLVWPEEVPFVQWVFDNVELIAQESSRSGKMRLSVYQREIGNAVFHDPACRQVTVLKGVQIGYSKLLRVIFAYAIAVLAKRVAIAFPVDADMERFLKDEILTLYERVKAVGELLRPVKRGQAADTSNEHRYSNGAQAYFRSAHNEDDLQGFTSWLQIIDEADRSGWQPRGASAGDKVNQFRNRGTDFFDSKLIIGSTPGLRDTSVIWREWETSDKRKLFVACPHCGTEQELRWGSDKTRYGFRWKLDEQGHVEEAWYQCDSESRCKIDEDNDKEAMLDAGVYRPTAIPTVPGNVGIHAPSWISMSPGARWRILAQQWLAAQRAKAEGNLDPLKEFVTFKMAEPWDDLAGASHDPDSLRSLQVPYPAEVPDDAVVLLCGVDTQSNKEGLKGGDADEIASREATVYGWSPGKMPRAIAHHVIVGEPGDPSADAELDRIRRRPYLKRDGTRMTIQATAIDMGGHYGDQTKAYCAARRKENCWAVKGRNQTLGTRSASVWPKKVSRNPKAGTTWFMIDTQLAKDAVGRMLRVRGPGQATFPESFDDDFFEGLAAEALVTDKKGHRYWKRKKSSNTGEQWDCLVYAYAALCGLQASFAKWRDLNVAAANLGVRVLPPHDPETGELLEDAYHGPDHSIGAAAQTQDSQPLASKAPAKDSKNAQTAGSTETQKPEGVVKKRKKRRVMRVIR
jgi:phage terminase large subunit GpA-like protein